MSRRQIVSAVGTSDAVSHVFPLQLGRPSKGVSWGDVQCCSRVASRFAGACFVCDTDMAPSEFMGTSEVSVGFRSQTVELGVAEGTH